MRHEPTAAPMGIGANAPGAKMARGTAAFTGSSLNIDTGLSVITEVIACVKDTNQSAGDAAYVTYNHGADGLLDLYAWDDAGVAAANAATVTWLVFGT